MTDLCLVLDIVIPPKFKVPDFDRYKGTTCPKNHFKTYCRKIGAYSKDEKLLMHFFQDSLAAAAIIWYTNLEASRIRTRKDLITAFLRQYQYNYNMAPDRTQLQNMVKWESESFKEYAQRWRDLAAQVASPMVEREMVTMMVDTLPVFYYEKLVGYMPSSFTDLVFTGERIEVSLKRGKFDYVSSTGTNARRIGAIGQKVRKEIPMSSLQRLHGSSHRRSPTVPTNMHNITRASQLAPGTPPTQRPCNLGHPRPSRGRPPKLRLQPRLARLAMPTLASIPMR